ncbi:MAG: autotransporter domain-containing protein [Deltaproteobacteria bacterium]|nr:autotransporter domain-containing protein [Deltaproteobacteria bacterium]
MANSIHFAGKNALDVYLGQNSVLTVHDPMSGTGEVAIAQNGSGLWNLGGESVFTGKTTFSVNGGTLRLYGNEEVQDSNSANVAAGKIKLSGSGSSFSLASGATLELGDENVIAATNVNLAGGSILAFNLPPTPTNSTSPLLTLTGTTTVTGTGQIQIDFATLNLYDAGEKNYTLVDSSIGAFTAQNVNTAATLRGEEITGYSLGGGSLDITIDGGDIKASINLITAQPSEILTWLGSGNGSWNISSSDNWKNASSSPTGFMHGDIVNFDDTGRIPPGGITLNPGGVEIAGIYLSGSEDYAFTGGYIVTNSESGSWGGSDLSASGKLTLGAKATSATTVDATTQFSGVLDLTGTTGANQFREGIDINSGSLRVANSGQLGTDLDKLQFLTALATGISSKITDLKTSLTGYLTNPNSSNYPNLTDGISDLASAAGTATGDGTLATLVVAENQSLSVDSQGGGQNWLTVGSSGNPKAASIYLEKGATFEIKNNLTPGTGSLEGGAIKVFDGGFLSLSTEDGTAIFKITNNSSAKPGSGSYGGALYNEKGTVAIENAIFADNTGHLGGAIFNDDGLIVLKNVEFNNNSDPETMFEGAGGAINNNGNSQLIVSDSKFIDNHVRATSGAIYNNAYSVLTISGSQFIGNKGESGGAIANNSTASGYQMVFSDTLFQENQSSMIGGALFNDGPNTRASLTDVQFIGNQSISTGGAVSNYGTLNFQGAVLFSGNKVTSTIQGSSGGGGALDNRGVAVFDGSVVFEGNSSVSRGGGALHNINVLPEEDGQPLANAGTITFYGTAEFKNNQSNFWGGAINNNSSVISFTGESVFTGNTATGQGGAIMTFTVTSQLIYGKEAVITFAEKTAISGNSSNMGAGIFANLATIRFMTEFEFTNNTALMAGGAMLATNASEIYLNVAGKGLFSGNTAAGKPNSIDLSEKSILTVDVTTNSLLDMHDPMSGHSGNSEQWVTFSYPVEIEKNGEGLWKLGGANNFTVTADAIDYITFTVNAGELYLYGADGLAKDVNGKAVGTGSITLDGTKSVFRLASGATLNAGGGNSIIIEGGKIELASGSTLAFDIANYTPAGAGGTTGLTLKAADLDWKAGSNLNPDIDLSSFKEGTFDLITAVGEVSGLSLPTVTLNGQTTARANLTLALKPGAVDDTLQLTASMVGGNMNITWDNSVGDEWTIGGQDWEDDGTSNPTNFMPGDAVTFGTGTTDIQVIDSGVEVAGMDIDDGDHSFSGGAISSTGEVSGSDVNPTQKLRVRNAAEAKFSNRVDFKNGLDIDSAAKVTLAGDGSFADDMAIANDGELVFDTAGDYAQNGVITGDGTLTKDGDSTLTLTAQNTYTGDTTVIGGQLTVAQTGGVAGDVNVNSGGLEVRGTVGGSVDVAASPGAYLVAGSGGSIGGDLTMGNNSVLQIANENKALSISGDTDLGSITPTLYGLTGWENKNYLVLEVSDENDLASFATPQPVSNYALVSYSLEKYGNKLVLAVSDVSNPVDVAITRNQKAVASVLGTLKTGGKLKTFLDSALINMNEEEYLDALDQLAAPVFPQVQEIAASLSHGFSKNVISHLAEKHWLDYGSGQDYASSANAPAAGAGDFSGFGHNLWFSAGGFYARYDGEDNLSDTIVTGYDIRLGYDLSLEGGWLAGAALGFDNQRIGMDRPYGRVDVDTFSAAIYGGRQFQAGPGNLRLLLGASFSSHSIDSERVVNIAGVRDSLRADYHGQTWQVFGEAAWNFNLGPRASLEPYLNLTWQKTTLNSFNENGRLFSLTSKKSSSDNFRTNLGLRAKAQITDRVSISGALGWEHTFGSVRPETTLAFRDSGSYFKVRGTPTTRDSVTAEVSLKVKLSESVSLQANYDGAFGKNAQRHAGSAVFSYTWK